MKVVKVLSFRPLDDELTTFYDHVDGVVLEFTNVSIAEVRAHPSAIKQLTHHLREPELTHVVFTSPRSIKIIKSHLEPREFEGLLSRLNALRVYAIGPSTKGSLEEEGIRVSATPEKYSSRSLAVALIKDSAKKVLAIRSEGATSELVEICNSHGVEVLEVRIYSVVPRYSGLRLMDSIDTTKYDYIVFTSKSEVEILHKACTSKGTSLADLLRTSIVVAIGPVTASSLKRYEVGNLIVSEEHTIEGIKKCILKELKRKL